MDMQNKSTSVKDPVCGMDVDRNRAVTAEREGETYYFCSQSCKGEFDANPAAYAQRSATKDRNAEPREQQGAGTGKTGQKGQSGPSRPGQSGQRSPSTQNPRGPGEERGTRSPQSTERTGSKSALPRELDDEAET
jgi:Cu+-exporting ATPase